MIADVIETVLVYGPRFVGFGTLKLLTFGRYRGLRDEDLVFEGAIGLAVLMAVSVLVYVAL